MSQKGAVIFRGSSGTLEPKADTFLGNTERIMRNTLKSLGFVRVDGLNCFTPYRKCEPIKANPGDEWRRETNNGKIAVASPEGEVWLRAVQNLPQDFLDSLKDLRGGIFVPCSNMEDIPTGEFLRRIADPDWENPVKMWR